MVEPPLLSSPSPLPMVEYLKVMAALTVEPAYASLTVEYLKVMAALTVEPAYASLGSST